jgi:hypothetical protein
MKQLALLDRMDEFFALGLGLHGIPTKSPDGARLTPGTITIRRQRTKTQIMEELT